MIHPVKHIVKIALLIYRHHKKQEKERLQFEEELRLKKKKEDPILLPDSWECKLDRAYKACSCYGKPKVHNRYRHYKRSKSSH